MLQRHAAISAGTWRCIAVVVICVGSMLIVELTAAAGTRTFTVAFRCRLSPYQLKSQSGETAAKDGPVVFTSTSSCLPSL